MRDHLVIGCLMAVALLAGAVEAQHMDVSAEPEDVTLGEAEYSPYLHQGFPQRPFWGDTHLHTSYSTDAGMVGFPAFPDGVGFVVMAEVMQDPARHVQAKASRRVFIDEPAVLKDRGRPLRRAGVSEGAPHRLDVGRPEQDRPQCVGEHLGKPCSKEPSKPSGVELTLRHRDRNLRWER